MLYQPAVQRIAVGATTSRFRDFSSPRGILFIPLPTTDLVMASSHIGWVFIFWLSVLAVSSSVPHGETSKGHRLTETIEGEDFPYDDIYQVHPEAPVIPAGRMGQESSDDDDTRFLEAIVGVLRREGLDQDDIRALFHMLEDGQIDIEHLAARKRRSVGPSLTDASTGPGNSTQLDSSNSTTTTTAMSTGKTKSQPNKKPLMKKRKPQQQKPLKIRKKSIDWNDYPGFDGRSADVPVGPGWNRQSISGIEQVRDTEAAVAAALDAMGTYEDHDNRLSRFIEQQDGDVSRKRRRQLIKRRPQQHDKQRTTRPLKQQKHRVVFNAEQCPLMSRIVSNCNSAEVLMGGYRQLLIDACLRYEACSLCDRNHDACDRSYRRHSVALCGPDLLCRAQSQRVAWGLGDIHDVVDDISGANFNGYAEVNCENDPCVTRLLRESF